MEENRHCLHVLISRCVLVARSLMVFGSVQNLNAWTFHLVDSLLKSRNYVIVALEVRMLDSHVHVADSVAWTVVRNYIIVCRTRIERIR